jgi:ribonucleoside-diphosphate reductase alpha chain
MLDASVDLGTMPIKEAEISANLLRNIGVGIVGLADWMAYNKLTYDTQEGRDEAEKLTEKIAYYCYSASIELAKEKGAYPLFNQANYDKLFGKTPEDAKAWSEGTDEANAQLIELSKSRADYEVVLN